MLVVFTLNRLFLPDVISSTPSDTQCSSRFFILEMQIIWPQTVKQRNQKKQIANEQRRENEISAYQVRITQQNQSTWTTVLTSRTKQNRKEQNSEGLLAQDTNRQTNAKRRDETRQNKLTPSLVDDLSLMCRAGFGRVRCITTNAKKGKERQTQREKARTKKNREIRPSKNKLLVLVPQRGSTSSIVFQLSVT